MACEHGEKKTHKVVIMPKPKMPVPMIGMMYWMCACADQPYQLRYGLATCVDMCGKEQTHKTPIGTNSEPNTRAGIRYSGLVLPPFFAVSYNSRSSSEWVEVTGVRR